MPRDLKPGTPIVNKSHASGLAMVVRPARINGATGYDVQSPTGDPNTYAGATVFCPDYLAVPAVVGETVCVTASGGCWCGLVHVTADRIAGLRVRAGRD